MTARLMLVALSLGWGVTWSTMRIALMEIPPLSMRVATMFIGAATLWLLTRLRRRSFALRSPTEQRLVRDGLAIYATALHSGRVTEADLVPNPTA